MLGLLTRVGGNNFNLLLHFPNNWWKNIQINKRHFWIRKLPTCSKHLRAAISKIRMSSHLFYTSGFAASRVQSEAYRSDDRRSRAFGARFSIYKSFRMPIIYLHTWIQTLTRTHARERNVKLFGSILTYSTPMKNL